MRGLVLNFFLAFTWVLLSGEFSRTNFVVGLVLGYGVLSIFRNKLQAETTYFRRFPALFRFVGFFLWELFKANLRVAFDVLTPGMRVRPAIVRVPLRLKTDLEITLLANLITLTPGTLTLDVAEDKSAIYVHVMYVEELDSQQRQGMSEDEIKEARAEAFRQSIKDGFERRIWELFR